MKLIFFTQDDIESLEKLNDEAKELVKAGEFRQLSGSLVDIYGKKKKFFEVDLQEIGNKGDEKYRIEREILRFKLFVYQHLDYYDALDEGYKESDAPPEAANSEITDSETKVSLAELFGNIEKLRRAKIIELEEFKVLAQEMFEKILEEDDKHDKESWNGKSENEKKMWQERIWMVLAYCHELFRKNRVEETIENLERLQHIVFEKLASKTFNCFATKATLLGELAKSHRRNGNYRRAEMIYYEAAENYLHKAKNPKKPNVNPSEVSYRFRRIAQVYVFGLQQINSSRSEIERCKANLTIAELLLSTQKGDETTPKYVELSKGVIKRIQAGEDKKQLEEARDKITAVKKEFEILSHRRLIAKCNWELAIIYHLLEEHTVSEQHIKEFETFYKPKNDLRAVAKINILSSHIERRRGQLQSAVELALEGLAFAQKSKNIIAQKDAHIALAESVYELNKHGKKFKDLDAGAEFEKCLKLNEQSDNKKINAICYLGLCKVAAIQSNLASARKYWEKYQSIRSSIQHKFVLDALEPEAREKLEKLEMDFVIPSNTTELDYKKQSLKLKKWLYEKAAQKLVKNKMELAKTLGVSRQTLHEWEGDINESKNKKAKKLKSK